jgi:murein DD-endopeptidase MepM/ murein hydrolase activator NlpD
MYVFILSALLGVSVLAQDMDVALRPDVVYVETLTGSIIPVERVFFHIVIENKGTMPLEINSVRFDISNAEGVLVSGQYSGNALQALFNSAVERKRIEPSAAQTLEVGPGERKAISDIFVDLPQSFIGESLVAEVAFKSGGGAGSKKATVMLQRTQGFVGRLPFDGTWYVAAEHGYLDSHKRFRAEAFAYDFLQIGPNGKSFQRDGRNNGNYYAYGKRVLAAKDGNVVSVRNDIIENLPGETRNIESPGGNLVIIDHGDNQFGYYAHLKPSTVKVKPGVRVAAGDVIGEVGNSGDSTEPHLHFHVMNNADPEMADGIPIVFENWAAQSYSRFPVSRKMGIIPRGEFVQP